MRALTLAGLLWGLAGCSLLFDPDDHLGARDGGPGTDADRADAPAPPDGEPPPDAPGTDAGPAPLCVASAEPLPLVSDGSDPAIATAFPCATLGVLETAGATPGTILGISSFDGDVEPEVSVAILGAPHSMAPGTEATTFVGWVRDGLPYVNRVGVYQSGFEEMLSVVPVADGLALDSGGDRLRSFGLAGGPDALAMHGVGESTRAGFTGAWVGRATALDTPAGVVSGVQLTGAGQLWGPALTAGAAEDAFPRASRHFFRVPPGTYDASRACAAEHPSWAAVATGAPGALAPPDTYARWEHPSVGSASFLPGAGSAGALALLALYGSGGAANPPIGALLWDGIARDGAPSPVHRLDLSAVARGPVLLARVTGEPREAYVVVHSDDEAGAAGLRFHTFHRDSASGALGSLHQRRLPRPIPSRPFRLLAARGLPGGGLVLLGRDGDEGEVVAEYYAWDNPSGEHAWTHRPPAQVVLPVGDLAGVLVVAGAVDARLVQVTKTMAAVHVAFATLTRPPGAVYLTRLTQHRCLP